MTKSWPGRLVMVTGGGGGFRGQAIERRLQAAEMTEVVVPRSRDYDLRTQEGGDDDASGISMPVCEGSRRRCGPVDAAFRARWIGAGSTT